MERHPTCHFVQVIIGCDTAKAGARGASAPRVLLRPKALPFGEGEVVIGSSCFIKECSITTSIIKHLIRHGLRHAAFPRGESFKSVNFFIFRLCRQDCPLKLGERYAIIHWSMCIYIHLRKYLEGSPRFPRTNERN